ncbi:bifunctional 4-hydroxy-2-oxoglutarate aldolase/2-dehydro-3-deoxy-phosphogluconate aldolase [Marinospirillum sp. MEB164]|uniref:Bifunctional 4-hydroxy-2-oxoglutarate aldolase/2-dehydro-3-deoxy-phosphogluconate aldolase n=1 Tax=Marinospirillum alkalitolerans TaxID=3123374 RepID=A0ABW8Q0L8_9GAMM
MASISPFDWGSLLEQEPLLPVWSPCSTEGIQAQAERLQSAGYGVVEVTLRHEAAWSVLTALKEQGMTLVAGSVRQLSQLKRLRELGIRFAVSPGWCPHLARQAQDEHIQLLPGIATAGEAMQALAAGYHCVKLFPARALGGPDYLRALQAPFPELRVVPTGGLQATDLADWFALPSVLALGGAWMLDISSEEAQRQRQQAFLLRQCRVHSGQP